jgi:predicted nucleic acid-binding protein
MPGDKIFLDTNVLVYAHDLSAGHKHDIASQTITELWDSGCGLLSTQVLQEFFFTVTKKIPKPFKTGTAKEVIQSLLKWDVVVNDGETILEAIELHHRYGYSFWDAMIIQAAIQGGADLLFSEDLSHGQRIEGVLIKNPFREILNKKEGEL